MAQEYKLKLLKKKAIAEGTMSIHFEKPAGFIYKAGQSVDLTMINPPETDDKGNTRTFTLASAPYEDTLMIATRLGSSAFKRTLQKMDQGDQLKMTGPFGTFVLAHDSSVPIVFITGGIGVTPARSIITQATHDQSQHKIYLFYVNSTVESIIFIHEFAELKYKNPNFKPILSLTGVDNLTQWKGEKGRVNKEMLVRHLREDIYQCKFFISGPLEMVNNLRSLLVEAGINEDHVRTEDFPGY